MPVIRNQAAVDAVCAASFHGQTPAQRKSLYVAANAFNGIDLDSPIYRIVPERFFLNDVREEVLTHTKIGPKMWGDTYENPLLKQQFFDKASDTYYDLSGILDEMYGVCWTADSEESLDNWHDFSQGSPAVRVQTTPRKLLSEVMNVENPYFMLHHFIGKVEYSSKAEIDAYIGNPDVSSYLDSLGHELAVSLMNLRNHAAHEREVRLIYSHMPNGNTWVEKNVRMGEGICRLPFQWGSVVDGIVVGPGIEDGGEASLISALQGLGHDFPVWSSVFRRFIG